MNTSLSDHFLHFTFQTTVCDLGVTLDSALTFSQHISNLTRSSYFQLRRLRTIRKAVSVPIFTSIVHAFDCSLTGGSSLSLGLGQLWLNLDPFRLLTLRFGIAFHHQLVLHSYHPIFLLPYHFLKLVSLLGANETKSAYVGPRLFRGAI